VRHLTASDTTGRSTPPPVLGAWIEWDGQALGRLTEPRSRRSTIERSVSERSSNSTPTRTTPLGPAFAFRTSPVSAISIEGPTDRRTEMRQPTSSDEPGWRTSIPTPNVEMSKTPQSRHIWDGSPSTWQEPIHTADWRSARRRLSTVHPPDAAQRRLADAEPPSVSVDQSPDGLEQSDDMWSADRLERTRRGSHNWPYNLEGLRAYHRERLTGLQELGRSHRADPIPSLVRWQPLELDTRGRSNPATPN